MIEKWGKSIRFLIWLQTRLESQSIQHPKRSHRDLFCGDYFGCMRVCVCVRVCCRLHNRFHSIKLSYCDLVKRTFDTLVANECKRTNIQTHSHTHIVAYTDGSEYCVDFKWLIKFRLHYTKWLAWWWLWC